MSVFSQSFLNSLKPTLTVSCEHIRITIRQLPITIERKQFNIVVAVGLITDDFIIGMDFLLEHHCIVNVESSICTIDGYTVYPVMKKGSSASYIV